MGDLLLATEVTTTSHLAVWEVTMDTLRCPCQTGGSGRWRGRQWSSPSRGLRPGALKTHGHVTRHGDTWVAFHVQWPSQTCCSKDSSGASLPSRSPWLLSTPCSHRRRATTDVKLSPSHADHTMPDSKLIMYILYSLN